MPLFLLRPLRTLRPFSTSIKNRVSSGDSSRSSSLKFFSCVIFQGLKINPDVQKTGANPTTASTERVAPLERNETESNRNLSNNLIPYCVENELVGLAPGFSALVGLTPVRLG